MPNHAPSPQPLLPFALPPHRVLLRPCTRSATHKRARHSAPTMTQPDHITHHSRRAVLLSAAVSATLLLPRPTHAYSSPYKPGQTKEQSLPERLYTPATNSVITTPSGLQYFDLLPGTGAEARLGDTVFIYYTSRLRGLYGIKVQSTYDDPTSPPLILRLGAPDVVPGVSEALTGMRVGGKRRAVLPPDIAYKSADMKPAVTDFFARRRLLSVLETSRDATIVFE